MDTPTWTIYCHIHRESGRRYIGQTKKTWRQRWNQHVYTAEKLAKKGWSHFANAIRKYGKDAFEHEVLEICTTVDFANTAEEKWIAHFNTCDPLFGFNIKKGGDHVPHPVRNPWDRPGLREKASRSMKEAWKNPEFRARWSELGKEVFSRPENVRKMAESKRGLPLSDKHKENLSKALMGRSLSPEHVAKSAASRKGMKMPPEQRAKVSESLKGRKQDPTHTAKVAATNRARPKADKCKSGHSLDDAYVVKGRKFCRICQARRSASYYVRKKSSRNGA